MVDEYRTLEDLVRNLYANVFWTHKIHEKQAEIHECWFAWLSVFNIIFAAATSAGIISLIFTDPQWLKVGSAVTAFITTALSAVLALFDLKSRARDNKSTATKLECLRNELLTMLEKKKKKNHARFRNKFMTCIRMRLTPLIVQLIRLKRPLRKIRTGPTLTSKSIKFFLKCCAGGPKDEFPCHKTRRSDSNGYEIIGFRSV